MKKMYLIKASSGEYDDFWYNNVCIVEDVETAILITEALNNHEEEYMYLFENLHLDTDIGCYDFSYEELPLFQL